MRFPMRLKLAVFAAVLLAALAAATPAGALSSWWKLRSEDRPGNLHAGAATPEVQKLTFKAVKGDAVVWNPENFFGTFVVVPYKVSTAELQNDLETRIFPGQKALVTGGAGEYTIALTPGRTVPQLEVTDDTGEYLEFVGGEPLEGEVPGSEGEVTDTIVANAAPDGQIIATLTNLGDASADGTSTPVTVTDHLPSGLEATAIEGVAGEGGGVGAPANYGPVECVLQTLTCTFAHKLPPYTQIEVTIGVTVKPGATTGELNRVGVSGGDTPVASIARPITVGEAPTPFGVETYELSPEEEGGGPATQAGSHPFQLTTTLALNQITEHFNYYRGNFEKYTVELPGPAALPKDLNFNLPPGLIGNPTPFPRCSTADFLKTFYTPAGALPNACPPQTAVGVAAVTVGVPFSLLFGMHTYTVPLFNLEPPAGEPARFGFLVETLPVYLDASVRTGGDYGVTVHVDNITQVAGFVANEVTFWGVPGDPRHNGQRGWNCLEEAEGRSHPEPCKPLEANETPPLLIMPTACSGPLKSTVEADSWAEEGVFSSFPTSEPMVAMDGCNRLPFAPSVKVTPDGQAGSTATGLTVDEHVPQGSDLNPTGLSESAVKGLSVTLPEGVALNPAAADGLQACSLSEIGLQNGEAPGCPDASKVATVKIKTPLLANALEGAAYLAEQDANPFGSLVAMYVYAEDPVSGVRAKAAGEVVENPVTGQLTAHFEGDPVFENDPRYAGEPEAQFLPEVPFEDIEVHFFGGDRAPLATPSRCGGYTTAGSFAPWAENGGVESSSEFQIVSGPNGTPCSSPLPFSPSLTAGTTSIQAGGFSPFTMTMSREDGEQPLQGVTLHMPPGVSGTLSGVKLCGEAQADAGTCGPESAIGETIVSVGIGGDPYTVKGGKVYITGPYEGAPFGLSIVNPAKAGPFDLGTVVVRAKLEVNRETAAITVVTDTEGPYKIPTLLDGIPLQIRHVNVNISRPGFTFNATDCNPLAITGSIMSAEGATSNLSVPYQATNCAVLAFKPKLEASTTGKWSRTDGTSFNVKLSYPAGPYDANISRVKVELPKALPSRLPTLQKACLASVFESNPAGCPAASIIGHARASTPVLPVPLEGPAYFVSHGGEAFPSLIIVLQGYGVTVHLVGTTFISKQGITSSTFKAVPDVPVGTFELSLPAGPYSALTGLGNLCNAKTLNMPTELVGQNGAEIHTDTKIAATGCGKAKKRAHKRKSDHHHKKKPHHGGGRGGSERLAKRAWKRG
ncbi:MAG TPA: hypothetical protein VNV42_05105 [Solirubrobacteraceae bacterium]|jgi:hypothetical protein|nr:hypothetical protein [Solirubrobacteraceae bacterium]